MTTSGILKQLFAAYPNVQVGIETVAMYVRLLQDIPPDELQTVVDQAVATSRFLPTIAELRDMRHSLARLGAPTWADAWDAVQREIRRVGSYGLPRFDDPLTERAVKAMGWKAICASDNPATDRAQFRDMYNALAEREETARKLLPQARELAGRLSEDGGALLPIGRLLGVKP